VIAASVPAFFAGENMTLKKEKKTENVQSLSYKRIMCFVQYNIVCHNVIHISKNNYFRYLEILIYRVSCSLVKIYLYLGIRIERSYFCFVE
jgi:hypothetical protein